MTDEKDPELYDRIPLDDITDEELTELYDDLDRYVEVVGDQNETIVGLVRQIAYASKLHRANCVVAKRMVGAAFTCSMCTALTTEDKDHT